MDIFDSPVAMLPRKNLFSNKQTTLGGLISDGEVYLKKFGKVDPKMFVITDDSICVVCLPGKDITTEIQFVLMLVKGVFDKNIEGIGLHDESSIANNHAIIACVCWKDGSYAMGDREFNKRGKKIKLKDLHMVYADGNNRYYKGTAIELIKNIWLESGAYDTSS